MILRDGNPSEPGVTLSPLMYHYQHRAELEVIVQTGDERDVRFDRLLGRIGAAVSADRTLRGLCDWVEAEAPEPVYLPVEGARRSRLLGAYHTALCHQRRFGRGRGMSHRLLGAAGDFSGNICTLVYGDKLRQNIGSDIGYAFDHHLVGFNSPGEISVNCHCLGIYMAVNLAAPVQNKCLDIEVPVELTAEIDNPVTVPFPANCDAFMKHRAPPVADLIALCKIWPLILCRRNSFAKHGSPDCHYLVNSCQ
jgi:hypothetical protein